jgi:choline dehydrogenase-like flavoprotein
LIIDARSVSHAEIIEADVCIVGAGPAGLALSHVLRDQPFRVCLLESGGFEVDNDTQSLAMGAAVGLPYYSLDGARIRCFGGSTGHWGGWCRPLDPIDFEEQEWNPHGGWPFGRAHLDPYYARAGEFAGLDRLGYAVDDWEDRTTHPRLPLRGDRVVSTMFQITVEKRFGTFHREAIRRAANLRAVLYANVTEIDTTPDGRTVTRVRVASLEGNQFSVRAKLYVLATGGIENARLLLLSNRVRNVGLGNQHDLVGRFFMEHLVLRTGLFLPSDPYLPADLYFSRTIKRTEGAAALALSEDVQRREKLLNQVTLLDEPFADEEEVGPGVAAFSRLSRNVRERRPYGGFWKDLRDVVADVDLVAADRLAHGGKRPVFLWRIKSIGESVPNPDSRVTLGSERDRLGQRRARLDWRLTERDRLSLRRGLEIIAEEIGRARLGRVRLVVDEHAGAWAAPRGNEPWTGPVGGYHHMGTTRMHRNPRKGVVDERCRVHGIANLFIAGSSVFPTGGCAHPTLTIIALALRLADDITRTLKG